MSINIYIIDEKIIRTLPSIVDTNSGIDCSSDIYGSMDIGGTALPVPEELEGDADYAMTAEDFVWWKTYGDNYNQTNDDLETIGEWFEELSENEASGLLKALDLNAYGGGYDLWYPLRSNLTDYGTEYSGERGEFLRNVATMIDECKRLEIDTDDINSIIY